MAVSDPIKAIEALEKRWVTPWGLVLGCAMLLGIQALLLRDVALKPRIFIAFVLVLILTIIWHLSRSASKTKRGKVGFVISLECETSEQRRKVRADFVRTLHELIKRGESGARFHIIELPDHIARRIRDSEDADDLRRRLRSHFFLYGRVRTREIDGKPCHFLNMEGVVSHRPIRREISDAFAKEMSEVFPRRVQLASENDILSFDFLSRWTDCVAKYIVGIAAGLSGDLDYAEKLFRDALKEATQTDIDLPALERIRSRVPSRLAELNEARGMRAHLAWRRTREPKFIEAMGSAVTAIDHEQFPKRAAFLRAIWLFLDGRRVDAAISVLKKAQLKEIAAWYLDLALLYAYKGDLPRAIRLYRKAEELPFEADLLNQVEDFMCWLIKEEPECVQMHYCLGFFEWRIKGDTLSACKDFHTFLELSDDSHFKKERELARQWLEDMDVESVAA